ncbi:LLM class F420-dependent oxidoreductase [Mycolicibacterium fluoranthenivorans]|jgi:probable F420-dependent oxidoreductase|uniref:LLM class F420-dependent oxidoreductase n=1 Tax=Mycolicibacterium fluoranthenivorans TaxID=258505 RepID=A0A7G8PHY7_9MYCO|nr:LLM class F420-dependent oxidoreductase [Mycolicibacterium fluoranthenivorans]QNJ93953.1 LLM class F420-dependent oxidoreductase [Mycolicibacterium fluoranthenivorans]
MNQQIQVALPLWLDRPDAEALDIAQTVRDVGLSTLWIGEMATFDGFALATAIGLRTPGLRLKVGPLPISVRNPVSIALGASSVASLTGSAVDVALGASSPPIVAGWHGRDWRHSAARMGETIECLRPILAGDRSNFEGNFVRSKGFRLRHPLPDTRIAVGAFGPKMCGVAARLADEIVLNLVSPQRVREVRCQIDADAAAAGRTPPQLTVWLPIALSPGRAAIQQVSSQLAVYLAPPGYGEMFCELGFADLVARARTGQRRSELAATIPVELIAQVCAIGNAEQITARLQEYLDAGADTVAVSPATAEDPGGRAALSGVSAYQPIPSKKEIAI